MTKKKLKKIDEAAPGTALEQLGDVDPAAAAELMGTEPPVEETPAKKVKRAKKAKATPVPTEEPVKADLRIIWPSRPEVGTCVSAKSWHTWTSKCGRFQIARSVSEQEGRSGFSCQFRESALNGSSSWTVIAHTKLGVTYPQLFKTLQEVLEVVEKFAITKIGVGFFNGEQMLSEAEKMGMADVPATAQKESSRRVAEVINVLPYQVEGDIVKISKTKAVELLEAVFKKVDDGPTTANIRQPVKVLAKNLATLPKLDGINDIQLDDDGLQTILDDVLKDLADGKKGVEVVEDAPAKGGKGKKSEDKPAKASKNGESSDKGKGFGTHTGQRYDLFGHPVTAVIRWMGKNKFDFATARKALDDNGVACADATVKIQLRAGAKGERGEPAKITKEEAAKLGKAGK